MMAGCLVFFRLEWPEEPQCGGGGGCVGGDSDGGAGGSGVSDRIVCWGRRGVVRPII